MEYFLYMLQRLPVQARRCSERRMSIVAHFASHRLASLPLANALDQRLERGLTASVSVSTNIINTESSPCLS
jgi:hypothetical protein